MEIFEEVYLNFTSSKWPLYFSLYSFVFLLVSRGISVGSNEKTFDIQKFTAYILDYRLLVYV